MPTLYRATGIPATIKTIIPNEGWCLSPAPVNLAAGRRV